MLQALRAKLTSPESAAAARLSKKLVTIHTDVDMPPLRFPWSYLALTPPTDFTRGTVQAAFAKLEFKQHARRLSRIWQKQEALETSGEGEEEVPVQHPAGRPDWPEVV